MTLLGIVLAIVVVAIFWRIFAGLTLIIIAVAICIGFYIGLINPKETSYDHKVNHDTSRRP